MTKNGIGHVAGSIKHRGFAAIEHIRYTVIHEAAEAQWHSDTVQGQVAFRRRTEKHKLGVYGGGGSKDCEKEEEKNLRNYIHFSVHSGQRARSGTKHSAIQPNNG